MKPRAAAFAGMAMLAFATLSSADEATFATRSLTPEIALKAAQAALHKCRGQSFQVAVTVVDRSGLAQVLLRDRFAGPHTVNLSADKAWSALTFRTNTSELEKLSRPGQPMAGLRGVPRMTAIGGGVMIEAGGSLLGAIGVSGAPGGDADEACALAGLKAITEDLEL